MPQNKRMWTQDTAAGNAHYVIVKRQADGYLLDDATGSFTAAPADPYALLAEHATIRWLWERSEARQAWNDGEYLAVPYRQTGGSPAPASDVVLPPILLTLFGDFVVTTEYLNARLLSLNTQVAALASNTSMQALSKVAKTVLTDLQDIAEKVQDLKKGDSSWRGR